MPPRVIRINLWESRKVVTQQPLTILSAKNVGYGRSNSVLGHSASHDWSSVD